MDTVINTNDLHEMIKSAQSSDLQYKHCAAIYSGNNLLLFLQQLHDK
jgi:hypothetical protein